MEVLVQVGLMALGFVMLIKGADWFVDGAAGIAARLGISQLVIGLTIVAMGTSTPEAAVSISSALKGNADITIGNIVGSNILNILIILGLAAMIVPLRVARSTIRYEIPYMILITFVLLVLGYTGGEITFGEGIVLWVFYVIYLGYLYVVAKQHKNNLKKLQEQQEPIQGQLKKSKEQQEPQELEQQNTRQPHTSIGILMLQIAAGIFLVVLGSSFTVDGATAIAQMLGISERFIGLTIVALGTSLPELVTSVNAAIKGNADIAIGNIVGSNIFNILFIVGTTALITPVVFAPNFLIDTLIAAVTGFLLLFASIRNHRLTRGIGLLMLACYAGYFIYLL
ncbi:MAG: calcium/sodium antiporter [Acetatifactor sp.]